MSAAGGPWRSWFRPCPRSPTCCSTPCAMPKRATTRAWNRDLAALRSRHEDACRELLPEARHAAVMAEIHALIAEFERIAGGMAMLNVRPPRSVDEAVATGERLSALLVAEYLNSEGVPAAAVDAAERDCHRRRLRQRLAADGAHAREGPAARASPAESRACCRWSPGSTRLQPTDGPLRWDAAARISPRPFWPPRSTLPNCGSGPTWTAS